jgi:hypothetical protein
MNLNMTSIKDAWGVNDISSAHSTPDRIQKSSFYRHPNAIVDTRPSRIDVALFDRDLITELYSHTPEYRTKLVTERLTRERTTRPSVMIPPVVHSKEPVESDNPPANELIEYFNIQNPDLGILILVTFVLLLLDKLATIWKNS